MQLPLIFRCIEHNYEREAYKMQLHSLTVDKETEWNQIAKSFAAYDVFYLASYAKAFQKHGDGEPQLLYYEDDNLRVMNVAMKRDISKDSHFKSYLSPNKFYDFLTPYGYGGFLFEGTVTNETVQPFVTQYINYCRSHNIVSEVMRYNPLTENYKHTENYFREMPYGPTVTIELTSHDDMWTNFTTKCRTSIRKAQKANITVSAGSSEFLMEKFQDIYNATMQSKHANKYYYFSKEFYEIILNELPDNHIIFYAQMDGEIVAAALVMLANQKMHGFITGSNSEFKSLFSTNILIYEQAKWGLENGYQRFHLGGGLGFNEDNLLKYKASFNRNHDTYYTMGQHIYMHDIYQALVELRLRDESFDSNSPYFPLYRA